MGNPEARLTALEGSIRTTRAEVKTVQSDLKTIKSDVESIKSDISSFKGSIRIIYNIVKFAAAPLLAWATYITYSVISMTAGGNAKLLSELKAPKSTEQLRATLSTVTAQIQTAQVDGKRPNERKLKELAGTLTQVAKQNPDVPESWRAIASLASYSSSEIPGAARRQDCDITQRPHVIQVSELPFTPAGFSPLRGYVFRNCVLHMDHLPQGKIGKGTGHLNNSPQLPDSEFLWGDSAFIFDCDVILTDSGIAESGILYFSAFNSRFEFQIEKVPLQPAQNLLFASVEAPGQFALDLSHGM